MKWPVSKVKISTSRLHHAEITIKHSKTDQYRDRAVVLMARTGQPTCTVAILERYLSMLGAQLQPNQYPFRNITKTRHGEKLRPGGRMSYSWVRELVLSQFKEIQLDVRKYGLHSLRAGGATAAANCGVPDRLFKQHGR